MTALVKLTDVSKTYRLGDVRVRALGGIDLAIDKGDFIALAGPSGSGKTTLLNLIGCIDKPDSGRIVIDSVDVTPVPLHRLASLRRDTLGFIFQTFNLIPVLTAYENVEYPLLLSGVPRRERAERVHRWLAQVGIADQEKQRPDQLSGGQRQRVAIARAMVVNPKLVLADEPTANLDSDTAGHILDLLAELNAKTGVTFVFSTHDASVIARAERVVRLRDGHIESTVILSREDGEGPGAETRDGSFAALRGFAASPAQDDRTTVVA
ncbi:MAG TPA: ABC transporter ATP-binding protein [Thermoanaerobaculia bacterium]|nr:ABC transporter ATP-binding protein [Thermoanaerobaculia bacterium]